MKTLGELIDNYIDEQDLISYILQKYSVRDVFPKEDIQDEFEPDELYSFNDLATWAEMNGFVKEQ